MKHKKSKYGVMICMPRPSDKRVVDETAEYIRQETKISWIGLAKGGVYAEAPEYARNAMVAEAREGDITHVLTLDADVVPPPNTILRLLQHDRDIIAGVYPLFVQGRKCWSYSTELPCIVFPDGEGGYSVKTKEIEQKGKADEISGITTTVSQKLSPYKKLPCKPFKVRALSGSTVLIRKEVFDKFYPWYKTIRWDYKPIMGHDFFFSNKAREAGLSLWVDPTIQCGHYNTVELNSVFSGE